MVWVDAVPLSSWRHPSSGGFSKTLEACLAVEALLPFRALHVSRRDEPISSVEALSTEAPLLTIRERLAGLATAVG